MFRASLPAQPSSSTARRWGRRPGALGLYARAYRLVLRKALYKRLTLTVRVRPGRAEKVSYSLTRVRVLETAAEIARTINGKRYPGIVALSGVLSHIARAQSDLGDNKSARKTMREAFQVAESSVSNWQSYALVEIVKGQKDVRDKAFALENLARAFELAKPIQDRFQRALTLSAIAKAQADAGDKSAAKQTMNAVTTEADLHYMSRFPYSLIIVAEAHGKAGNAPEARRIFEQAAAALKTDYLKGQNDHKLVAAMAQAGEIQAATNIALSRKGKIKWLVALIAEEQARSGDVAGALKTIRKMLSGSKWDAQGAHLQIVKGKVRAGDLQGALSIAKVMGGYGSVRVDALLEVADGQIRSGDKAGALRTLTLAHQKSKTYDGSSNRFVRISKIAAAQARAGDLKTARRTLEEAQKYVKDVERGINKRGRIDYWHIITHAHIALAEDGIGEKEAAERTLARALKETRVQKKYQGGALKPSPNHRPRCGTLAGPLRRQD